MKAIVVDLELSQVEGRSSQIIQIGAVVVDLKQSKLFAEFNVICKPEDPADRIEGLGVINGGKSTITQLTGITAEMVENGTPIAQALEQFWQWVDKQGVGYRIADWGGMDVVFLEKHSASRNIEHKRVKRFDLKAMLAPIRALVGGKIKGGLTSTLKMFGVEFEGNAHDALCDAKMTAKLWIVVLSKFVLGFNIERQIKEMEIRIGKQD